MGGKAEGQGFGRRACGSGTCLPCALLPAAPHAPAPRLLR